LRGQADMNNLLAIKAVLNQQANVVADFLRWISDE
jgi:hypothetical protein